MLKLLTVLIINFITLTAYALPAAVPIASEAPGLPQIDGIRLPEYTPCSENNVRYACYSLEQQKQLLVLEANAHTWQAQLYLLNAALVNKTRELKLVTEQLKITEDSVTRSVQHVDTLTKQLNDAINDKNNWRAKAEAPVVWPYVIGGVIGILGLGFGLGAAISL